MPAQQDRPNVELSVTNEFIIAQWGPAAGPYGIFNETMVAAPETVTIKEWWLFVGTKARPNETHEPPDHQSVQNDIVFQKMGTATELKIDRYLFPKDQMVLAQVIGFFESKDITGQPLPFMEGIYSDIVRKQIH